MNKFIIQLFYKESPKYWYEYNRYQFKLNRDQYPFDNKSVYVMEATNV